MPAVEEYNEILFFKVFRNVYLKNLILNNSYFIFDVSNSQTNGDAHFYENENDEINENNETTTTNTTDENNTLEDEYEDEDEEVDEEKEKEEEEEGDGTNKLIIAAVIAVAIVAAVALVGTFYYFYKKRESNNNFNELIKIDQGIKKKVKSFRLTKDCKDSIGSVWSKIKIPLISNILIKFQFQISLPTTTDDGNLGGDGFAIVFQNNNIKSISNEYGSSLGYNGIKNGLIAIEFDTYKNDGESNDNHISIQGTINNTSILSSDHKHSIASVQPAINLKDGNIHSVEIYYNKIDNTLSLSMDSILLLKNIKSPNLKNISKSFIGFTSSTGYYHSKTKILNCEIIKK